MPRLAEHAVLGGVALVTAVALGVAARGAWEWVRLVAGEIGGMQ